MSEKLTIPIGHFDQRGHNCFGSRDKVEVSLYKSPFALIRVYSVTKNFDCSTCGEHVSWEPQNPGASVAKLTFSTKASCAVPTPEAYEMKLAVPSGKIVFADSLWRDGLESPDDDELPSMNSSQGRKMFSKLCEAEGVAYGSVLNTSPSVFIEDGTEAIIVASPALDEEEEFLPLEGARQIGIIDTDLWAYSFMDHDDYLAKGGKIDEYLGVADVKPGLYTFTHYADAADFDFDADGVIVYAKASYAPLP